LIRWHHIWLWHILRRKLVTHWILLLHLLLLINWLSNLHLWVWWVHHLLLLLLLLLWISILSKHLSLFLLLHFGLLIKLLHLLFISKSLILSCIIKCKIFHFSFKVIHFLQIAHYANIALTFHFLECF